MDQTSSDKDLPPTYESLFTNSTPSVAVTLASNPINHHLPIGAPNPSLSDNTTPGYETNTTPNALPAPKTIYCPTYTSYKTGQPVFLPIESVLGEYVKISNLEDWKLRSLLPLRLASVLDDFLGAFTFVSFVSQLNIYLYNMNSHSPWVFIVAFLMLLFTITVILTKMAVAANTCIPRYTLNCQAQKRNPVNCTLQYYIFRGFTHIGAILSAILVCVLLGLLNHHNCNIIIFILCFIEVRMLLLRIRSLNAAKRCESTDDDLGPKRRAGFLIVDRIYKLTMVFTGMNIGMTIFLFCAELLAQQSPTPVH
ncbi:hypothetical protein NEHOM01_0316 [Nematocida homosporus]|uniref:uncharacterized protein n=1 Tax=Nematocida homosporus TaxID=1912981 RepID=UPI002220C0D8|nr:uncharacterized protein NEHOM01_0316 [Nematocida homosporus]KAI5184641.1 hypothetical protein NEHOM01_0316 [Nematocida homosporus]